MKAGSGYQGLLLGAVFSVVFASVLARKCKISEKTCRDGLCLPHWMSCPVVCESYEKKCPDDDKCVLRGTLCPGECNHSQKKCSDGSCVNRYSERCRGESCPFDNPLACPIGRTCYARHQKCNGKKECRDGYDEKDCSSSLDNWWYFLLIPLFAGLFILFCLYICCKYNAAANRMQTTTNGPILSGTQVQPPTSNTTRMNMPSGQNDRLREYRNEREELLSGRATSPSQDMTSAPSEPAPSAPPSYDVVVSSDQYSVPSAPPLGLPRYEEVSDIPPGSTTKRLSQKYLKYSKQS